MSNFGEFTNYVNQKINGTSKRSVQSQQRYDNAKATVENLPADRVKELAARALSSGTVKTVGADKNAQINQYDMKSLTDQWKTTIQQNPQNDWIKPLSQQKAIDIKFDNKMLDDNYAAWYSAKHGLTAYKGDFNNDGTSDIIVTDENGKIKYYNGYKTTPSKQRKYMKYHENTNFYQDPNTGAIRKAPGDPSFSDWVNNNSRAMAKQGTIDKYNAQLTSGMSKWKEVPMNLTDLVKEQFTKEAYEAVIQKLVEGGVNNTVARKMIKRQNLISIFIHAYLISLTGQVPQDDPKAYEDVYKEVMKNIMKKGEVFDKVRSAMKDEIVNLMNSSIANICQLLLQGVNKYEIIKQLLLNTQCSSDAAKFKYRQIVTVNNAVREDWKSKHPQINRNNNLPISQPRKAGKQTFNTSAIPQNQVMTIDDDDDDDF